MEGILELGDRIFSLKAGLQSKHVEKDSSKTIDLEIYRRFRRLRTNAPNAPTAAEVLKTPANAPAPEFEGKCAIEHIQRSLADGSASQVLALIAVNPYRKSVV